MLIGTENGSVIVVDCRVGSVVLVVVGLLARKGSTKN